MANEFKRILIAVKPWAGKLPIGVARASALARGLGAEVRLTTCVRLSALEESLAWVEPTMAMDTALKAPKRNDDEVAELERLAEPLRAAGLDVSTQVRTDDRARRGILDEVTDWRADLLIAGFHEPDTVPHLTDVDRQLMQRCPCPLLIADASKDSAYATILAAVDPLHEHAEPEGLDHAILRVAKLLRDALDARLPVVNACPDPELFGMASSIEPEPGVFYSTENIESAHEEAVAGLLDECGLADSEIVLRTGKPAEVIVELTRELTADLIVLGSIKRGPIESAILGSTAERIVYEAPADVLLVRPPQRQ
jgi:universal stress protein E